MECRCFGKKEVETVLLGICRGKISKGYLMSAKIFDVLIYFAATVVNLAIISGATQAEREFKEEAEFVDIIEIKEPLIKEELDQTSEIIFTNQP